MSKIVTSHVFPPIPDRRYDWSAYYDGREDGDVGYGKTEDEAVADLKENYDDPDVEATAKEWARLELAARDAEEELLSVECIDNRGVASLLKMGEIYRINPIHSWGPYVYLEGFDDRWGFHSTRFRRINPREAANTILSQLIPIFQESTRVRRWEEARVGKQGRLF